MFHMKPFSLKKEKLFEIIERFKGSKVLVVGDVILDRYQYGVVERISPEAPVPVVKIENEEYRLGGAANVANNLKELGADVFLIGSCGEDSFGEVLRSLLKKREIPCFLFKKCMTTVKTRIISQGQHLLRIDREDVGEENLDLKKISSLIKDFEVIIISDYAKGFVSGSLLRLFLDWSESNHTKILIDPKERNFSFYKGFFLVTPNKKEASNWWGKKIETLDDVIKAGSWIKSNYFIKNLVITLGKDGMVLFSEDGKMWKIKAMAQNVYDVTGAGDVVVSILGLSLSCGASVLESAFLANLGAGISVGKLGTATVSSKEILNLLEKDSYPLEVELL